jgi:electron transfer flavoprotein beta subunit
MEIIVAVKPVPEAETRLRSSPDGSRMDGDGIKWVLAGYDESAVEQALLLKEAIPGSKVRVISFGPSPRTDEVLRAALALGCDAATCIEQPNDLVVDPILAARALAETLRPMGAGLILCGKQAGDDEEGLVASALGELLGIASFGAVTELKWDPTRARFTFVRPVEGGAETAEAPSPSVLGLQQAWNDPRTAKLPNILKSRKAPIDRVPWPQTLAALGENATARAVPTQFRLPTPRTGAQMIAYTTPQEAAEKLVRILREEAKVFP